MKETVGRKAERGEETTVTERAARAGKEMDMGRRGRGVEVAAEKGTGSGRRKEREEGTETVTMITKGAGALAEIVIASEIGSLLHSFPSFPLQCNFWFFNKAYYGCLLYTSPSPRDRQKSRMPSSA